jgi:hypothetical protein
MTGRRAALAWALVAAVFGTSVAGLEPNMLEEGIVVHAAERMLGGEHLYRDILVFTAPLPYELLALGFRVLGAEIWVARAAVVCLQALATGLLFASARRAGLGLLAHAAAAALAAAPPLAFPLLSTYFYTTLAFYLCFVALYAALRAGESTGWAVAAGVSVGAIALCKQHTGAILAAVLLPGLWLACPPGERRSRLAGYAAGGLGLAVATLALYTLRGDLGALLHTQIEIPLALGKAASFATPFITLWPPGHVAPEIEGQLSLYVPWISTALYGIFTTPRLVFGTQLLYALPFAALGAAALRMLGGSRVHPIVWLQAAVTLAMTQNLYPRPDWGHLVVSLPAAIVLLVVLPAHTGEARPPRAWLGALAAYSMGLFACGALWATLALHAASGEPTLGPRVPLRPVSLAMRSPALSLLTDFLRARLAPGEEIFVARQEPLLYFATGARNPTPFPGVLPGMPELQEPDILKALERVRFVVMSDLDQPSHTYYRDELPHVWSYLERHFAIPDSFPVSEQSWIFALERGPDRGETAIDLIEARPGARAWIREADGSLRESKDPLPRLGGRQLQRPLPVVLGPLGGGVDYEIDVPPRAALVSAVGFWALASVDHWYQHPALLDLSVSLGRDGRFEELARVGFGERFWLRRDWWPVEVDLSRFAGERVTLRLEASSPTPIPGDRLAWWGSPRVVVGGVRRPLLDPRSVAPGARPHS